MQKKLLNCVYAFVAATTLVGMTGCGNQGGQAQKLEAPEGIDWEAIEAEGSEMAESQNTGE